jgi:hypothetical protein
MKDRMRIDLAQKEFILEDWGKKGQIFLPLAV